MRAAVLSPESITSTFRCERFTCRHRQGGWSIVVSGSDDRSAWKEVGRYTGTDFPGRHEDGPGFTVPIEVPQPVQFPFLSRGVFRGRREVVGRGEVTLSDQGHEVHVAGPDVFSSAWMSAGSGEEWVSIDLGARVHVRSSGLVVDSARCRRNPSDFRGWRACGTYYRRCRIQ